MLVPTMASAHDTRRDEQHPAERSSELSKFIDAVLCTGLVWLAGIAVAFVFPAAAMALRHPITHLYALCGMEWIGRLPWIAEFGLLLVPVILLEVLAFLAWRAHDPADISRNCMSAWERVAGAYVFLIEQSRATPGVGPLVPGWAILFVIAEALIGIVALTAWIVSWPATFVTVAVYFALPEVVRFVTERIDFDD